MIVSENPIETKLQLGLTFLADGGLNLVAVFDCAALPQQLCDLMADVPLADYQRLVLLGHGGRRLWEALQAQGMAAKDPVDTHSTQLAQQFIHDYLGAPPTYWLYPNSPHLVPLQQLGALAGWSHPSPLGLGISSTFGVWFAYRTAFLVDAELPLRREPAQASPCDSCVDKPCITTCPVSAVKLHAFDVEGCARFRIKESSPCAVRCLSRMACPYFPEHRYSLEQMQYHYGQSAETLRRWYKT